eukprot:1141517-Pelagomonas_calceolata.AAC.2
MTGLTLSDYQPIVREERRVALVGANALAPLSGSGFTNIAIVARGKLHRAGDQEWVAFMEDDALTHTPRAFDLTNTAHCKGEQHHARVPGRGRHCCEGKKKHLACGQQEGGISERQRALKCETLEARLLHHQNSNQDAVLELEARVKHAEAQAGAGECRGVGACHTEAQLAKVHTGVCRGAQRVGVEQRIFENGKAVSRPEILMARAEKAFQTGKAFCRVEQRVHQSRPNMPFAGSFDPLVLFGEAHGLYTYPSSLASL